MDGLLGEGRYVAMLSKLRDPGQLLERESWSRDEEGDGKEVESIAGEKCAESGEWGSRRSRTTGKWVCRGVQAGCTSTGEQGCSGGSGGVDAPSVSLESAVEREEEREGNSGIGRGDRQISDGDMSCGVSPFSTWGIYLSGRGGTTSLELESGHAPGKDGVGEAAGMMKEKAKKGEARQR